MSWPTARFEDLAHLVRRSWVPSANAAIVPYIGLEHIEAGGLKLCGLGSSDEVESNKSLFESGDILFGKLRPYFRKVVRPSFGGVCSTDIWVVQPKAGVDADYLFYLMASDWFVTKSSKASEGTKMPRAIWDYVANLEVKKPPLHEQQAIGGTLKSLDDKIDLNRRMNETLEAMARAIFKDWFVDFGPTRAKMEGRVPYLAPDLWALFPDRLREDGLPEGWESSTIGQEVEVLGGSTPSTSVTEYWDKAEHFWATPKDLSNLGTPVLLSTERKISSLGVSCISSGQLPSGTVLLSSRAPVGYLAISEVPVSINQGFIAMICNKRISNIFCYFWCHESMEAILSKANGSTFQEISKSNFRPISLNIASYAILEAFEKSIRPIWNQIVVNTKSSESLKNTRDMLLPKLMAGEVRIKTEEITA